MSVGNSGKKTRQRRCSTGVLASSLTKDDLQQWFHLPSHEACAKLGVSLSVLKRVCRRLGIQRWPYRAHGQPQQHLPLPTPSSSLSHPPTPHSGLAAASPAATSALPYPEPRPLGASPASSEPCPSPRGSQGGAAAAAAAAAAAQQRQLPLRSRFAAEAERRRSSDEAEADSCGSAPGRGLEQEAEACVSTMADASGIDALLAAAETMEQPSVSGCAQAAPAGAGAPAFLPAGPGPAALEQQQWWPAATAAAAAPQSAAPAWLPWAGMPGPPSPAQPAERPPRQPSQLLQQPAPPQTLLDLIQPQLSHQQPAPGLVTAAQASAFRAWAPPSPCEEPRVWAGGATEQPEPSLDPMQGISSAELAEMVNQAQQQARQAQQAQQAASEFAFHTSHPLAPAAWKPAPAHSGWQQPAPAQPALLALQAFHHDPPSPPPVQLSSPASPAAAAAALPPAVTAQAAALLPLLEQGMGVLRGHPKHPLASQLARAMYGAVEAVTLGAEQQMSPRETSPAAHQEPSVAQAQCGAEESEQQALRRAIRQRVLLHLLQRRAAGHGLAA